MAFVVAVLLALFVFPAPWGYAAIVCGAAIEVGEAAFWWRWTHRRRPTVGVEALVGVEAVVIERCRPRGLVRVGGELWSASCDEGADVGERVRIQALDGLMLLVERASAGGDANESPTTTSP